jgi:hypothetical protein
MAKKVQNDKVIYTNWRTPPAPIPESEITKEYTADVVVVGLGHAGGPAARAAAEAGASVIGIERMTKDVWWAWGQDVGHINSDFLASRGVPKVDPIELFNEWMRRSGNRANPKLVMQFCQRSGEAFNWYCEPFTKEQIAKMVIAFWPQPAKNFKGEISGQKFWVGTARFPEKGIFRDRFGPGTKEKKEPQEKSTTEKLFGVDSKKLEGVFSLSHALWANLEQAREHGAELYFGMNAQQLVMEGERVTGVIAKDVKGKYIKFNAKKGVILSTGDFGGNKEMCRDLLTDISELFDEGEDFRFSGRDGRGIQMGVWAGGRLEARPVPAMGGNFATPMGVTGSFGGIPWIDDSGRRYCNEGCGDPVFAGMPGAALQHGITTVVFDSSILDDLQCSPPAHGAFWFVGESAGKALLDNMASARKAGATGHNTGRSKLYAADTLEQLADYVGFKGKIKQSFLDTIKRYNRFAATGRDEDFGKDSQMLHAIDTPPYYANPVKASQMIGFFLCTVGGLLTDEYQNVLNQKKDPIPGLYATGNCCGRRFGPQYSTPISGVSIGIAITLGREVGRIAAEL